MPSIDFEHDGQRRSFLAVWPNDWMMHFGSLHLLIGLHAEYETAEDFYAEMEVEALLEGVLTPGLDGTPGPQKVLAIFPRALSLTDQLKGQWNAGVMGPEARIMGVRDIEFLVACVSFVQDVFARELLFLQGTIVAGAPLPAGLPTFYQEGKIMVAGKAAGGQLACRFQHRVQELALPANLMVRDRGLVPNVVAVAGSSAGGSPYWSELLSVPNPARPGAASLVHWIPGSQQSNLIQFQGTQDHFVSNTGAVSLIARDSVDARMGVGRGEGYYRYDLRPGPSDHDIADPNLAGTGIEPWVDALAPVERPVYAGPPMTVGQVGGSLVLQVAPAPLAGVLVQGHQSTGAKPLRHVLAPENDGPGFLLPYTQWTWNADPAGPDAGRAVSYVLHDEVSELEDGTSTGNLWPSTFRGREKGNRTADAFSATGLAWNFLLDHP